MRDLKQARELLAAAERDHSALRGMSNPVVFADEIFGFHAQQAVEKLLKTWLALLGEIYPATHDLTELLETLTARHPDAARFGAMLDYTPFAVQFRYAARDRQAPPLDRNDILGQVDALLEEVQQRLAEAEGA